MTKAQRTYLGIDLGTSGVKAVLMDDELNLIAQAQSSLTVSQPYPLWSEQNPEDWWRATQQAITELQRTNSNALKQVQAIGLSGQQHGATVLNPQGQVLRPAILWNDGRSHQQCELLQKRAAITEITGNPLMPGFTAPKLLWIKQHEPELFAQIDKILLPKDYLRWRMSGEFATDLSDASGTYWVNVAKRCYSNETIQASNLSLSQLPTLFEGTDITGTVTKTVAAQWGIPDNTPIVGGAGDNAACAISVGITQPGSAFISLGTSGVYFVASHHYQTNPQQGVHSMCHCLPAVWHLMTVHLSAASSLGWLGKQLHLSAKEMMQIAEQETRSHDTVIFLPYLSGERTPHNDAFARGMFFGMSHATQRTDLIHAVLEGVAFAFLDGQMALATAGIDVAHIDAVGGGAQSFYWGKILANVLQKPLTYRINREVGSALGAARLAWLGINQCDPISAFAQSPIEKIIEPESSTKNKLIEKYQLYRELYQRNKELFPKLQH